MEKKIYIQPLVEAECMNASSIICLSKQIEHGDALVDTPPSPVGGVITGDVKEEFLWGN